MGVVDVDTFPYTVPASTYYLIVGWVPSADSTYYKVTNSAGTAVLEGGNSLFTDATAYPYGYQYGQTVAHILIPGDVISVSGISAMRLLVVNLS
jgi:hypothetical protein